MSPKPPTQSAPIGVLLINTGSPDAPTAAALRPYLRQFLSDPRVLTMPALARWALVNLIIVPFRAPKSAEAYRKVWTPAGSPLVAHARALAAGLEGRLGAGWRVRIGMGVGNPSIAAGLEELAQCRRIILAPLFPQYASATVGSVLEASFHALAGRQHLPPISTLAPFHADPRYLRAVAEAARPTLDEFQPDRLIYSFHGLPESQVIAAGAEADHRCLSAGMGCCVPAPPFCYRAQCAATHRALVPMLGEGELAFQSRLGRARWLGPSLEERIEQAGRDGVRRLAVIAPSFVADCLETLEEIADRGAEQFKAAGGQALRLLPAPNAHPAWIEGLAGILAEAGA